MNLDDPRWTSPDSASAARTRRARARRSLPSPVWASLMCWIHWTAAMHDSTNDEPTGRRAMLGAFVAAAASRRTEPHEAERREQAGRSRRGASTADSALHRVDAIQIRTPCCGRSEGRSRGRHRPRRRRSR